MYIHQLPLWPRFSYNKDILGDLLANVRYQQGKLLGKMLQFGFELREEATLRILTEEIIKTSAIEGEELSVEAVRSSIANRMGIEIAGLIKADRNVEGIVEVMLNATKDNIKPLTKQRLFDWHYALFPTGRNGMHKINVGSWRKPENDPMQVVSGAYGREKVHYEAPSGHIIENEMQHFLDWFNNSNNENPVLKAAIAHFWFVTIHPFDDGNGRIARAISELLLARSEASPQRFYSMSSQIQKDRSKYYEILENSQKGNLDITEWIKYFLETLSLAVLDSENLLGNILAKAKFWDVFKDQYLNERQKNIINRLLEDFEGKLTSSKWAKICKCSQDTAIRDLKDLIEKGILKKDDLSGRSTSYSLVEY